MNTKNILPAIGATILFCLASCPAPLLNRKDVRDFVEAGQSVVSIRSVSFSVGGVVKTWVPSGQSVTAILDILNPSELDVAYTVSCSPDASCFTVPAPTNPSPASPTRLSFSFTPSLTAEHRDLVFTFGKYAASIDRTYESETITVRCDSPPNMVRDLATGHTAVGNLPFVCFRLPNGSTDTDLSGIEIVYNRADGTGSPQVATYGANDLAAVSDPNLLLDTDPLNRYFQPPGTAAGEAYDFWVTIIDAAGQRSASVSTSGTPIPQAATPVLSPATFSGVYTGGSTYPITLACATPGATIYWSHSGGASGTAVSGDAISIDRSGLVTVRAEAAGMLPSADVTGQYTFYPETPSVALATDNAIDSTIARTGDTVTVSWPQAAFPFDGTLGYSVTDSMGNSWTGSISGPNWVYSHIADSYPDGSYTVSVVASAEGKSTAPVSATFTVDKTPPVVSVNAMSTTSMDATVTVDIAETNIYSVTTTIDGGSPITMTYLAGSLWTYTYVGLSASTVYPYTINATDRAGNTTNYAATLTTDP